MEDQCTHAGIVKLRRVSATDASAVENYTSSRYAPHSWGPYWSLVKTEIACFESHRKTWEMIVDSGRPGAIFEDDILLSSSAGKVISRLGEHASRFDLVKLDALGGTFRFGKPLDLPEFTLREIITVLPSAAAYLLSPEGAHKLLQRSQTYCDHLDDFITRPSRGFRAYQLAPGVAVQGMFAELSGYEGIPANVAGSERTEFGKAARNIDRGPVLYRGAKELRRSWRKVIRNCVLDRRLVADGGFIGEIPLADDCPPFRR